jgi:hypothetical protein
MDGLLVKQGRRLAELTLIEMLNLTLACLLEWADADGRRKIELALEGRLGEHGGEIVDDPDLPASMQGVEAPSWWNSDHDPFADQHQWSDLDTSFYGVT